MPARASDAFPISNGAFVNVNPRWFLVGSNFAFISNIYGNTSLWVQKISGGQQAEIVAQKKARKYLKPMGRIALRVVDSLGKPVAARVFLTSSDGRAYAPDGAWMHADDSFDRAERTF